MFRHIRIVGLAAALLSLTAGGGEVLAARDAAARPANAANAAANPKIVASPHPRLLATAADFAALRKRCERNRLAKAGRARVLFEADQMLGFPLPSREKEGRRMLSISQRVLHRVLTLSLAARLTDEPKYARRAIDEMLAVAAYSDWNPAHFLDVAEMTLGVAIGYDWLHDRLTADERARIGDAIRRNGLCAPSGGLHTGWWVRAKSNWGQVCHAGMLAGACAISDESPDLARQVVTRAVAALPGPMEAFAPEGGFPEGPGFYWGYAMIYNALAIDILKGMCGTDFGLSRQPGFRESADYMECMTGPTGLKFNYADAGIDPEQIRLIRRTADPAVWWLAKYFARPDILTRFEAELYGRLAADRTPLEPEPRRSFTRLNALILLWQQDPAKEGAKIPLCRELKGRVPVTVQRSGWDRDAWYVGLKAGSPSGPHGHMDAGSFVLDAKGARWAWDLGSEDYNTLENAIGDIWGGGIDAPRWKVFRLGIASHNTLVIDGAMQKPEGDATIRSFRAKAPSEAVIDLSSLYPAAQEVTRTGTLLANGYRIVDRVAAKAGARVRWQMITPAKVAKVAGNVLTLTQQGKTLTLTAPKEATWQTLDVSAAPTAHESPNPGITQVYFELAVPAAGRAELAVEFR